MKQLRAFEKIHRLYTIFPFIRLLGISGSLSMLDADKNDDIDLFVVTSNSTLWLTRCYVLFVTRILSLFNHSIAPKLCWNIFMEEQCLSLPLHKQNEYTAHELIQLKIVYDKSDTAHKLQTDNQWIHDILPNVQINSKRKNIDYKPSWQHKVFKFIDLSLRYFQLLWLSKKGYTATEYESQVWFIQNDFEKKILIPLKKV